MCTDRQTDRQTPPNVLSRRIRVGNNPLHVVSGDYSRDTATDVSHAQSAVAYYDSTCVPQI